MLVQALNLSSGNRKIVTGSRRRGCGRAVILEVVRGLLRERGVDGLSMERVAQEAGYTRRTIYNHFASIAELFEISRKTLIAELTPLVPTMIAPQLPRHVALSRFAAQASRVFADDRHLDLMLSVVRDRHTNPAIVALYERDILQPMTRTLTAFLTDVQTAGRFSGDPRAGAFQLLWTLQAAATSSSVFGHVDGTDVVSCDIDQIVRAFLIQHAPPDAIAA